MATAQWLAAISASASISVALKPARPRASRLNGVRIMPYAISSAPMQPPNLSQLDAGVTARVEEYAKAFAHRDPFRHVVIDNFFNVGYAIDNVAHTLAVRRGRCRSFDHQSGRMCCRDGWQHDGVRSGDQRAPA